MNDINYLTKLNATLSMDEKLRLITTVTNPKISDELQSYFGTAFSIAGLMTSPAIPMDELGLALLTPNGKSVRLRASGLSVVFYWLKSINGFSLSEDGKTFHCTITKENLESHWTSMESWFKTFQYHIFHNNDENKDFQSKIILSSVFQGFHDGINLDSEKRNEFRAALADVPDELRVGITESIEEFTSMLRALLAETIPQPTEGRLEFTLGE